MSPKFYFFLKLANLGANAILTVSMAVCRAGAAAMQMPLLKNRKNHFEIYDFH